MTLSNGKVHTKSESSSEPPPRAKWDRPVEFVLACLGYAVGLGNVWRFPYLCYRNGGGAFLIPFFLMLIFIGLPIFFLELFVGQYTGIGPLEAFKAVSPFFSGVGYCTLVVITIISIYYMIIVAWTLFYTIVSFAGQLGWESCDSDYNTDFCYSGKYDNVCRENNTGTLDDMRYYRRSCWTVADICIDTGFLPHTSDTCLNGSEPVNWYVNVTRILASEEYYNERVLGRGDATWENWGTIQWHLVGCLALCWLVAFFCVIKGVQSAGKVVYFTALFPYVMLTVLLIRGVTLEGAGDGIMFYLLPKWETLLDARVWGDAASQIFYSFGVACGSLVTLASYNNFYNNCHFDAVFVSFTNFFTSIYAGFAIFSVLGFQAHLMGVSVDVFQLQARGKGKTSRRSRESIKNSAYAPNNGRRELPITRRLLPNEHAKTDNDDKVYCLILSNMSARVECPLRSKPFDLKCENMDMNMILRWSDTNLVEHVAADGPGLAFVAYPEAILQMPVPQLWAILFFFMLFILGLGSQFAGIEAINTAIVDRWPKFRKRYWMVTAFTCTSCFILGLPMCFSGGVYLFTLLDWNTASWAVLLIGVAELGVMEIALSYGPLTSSRAVHNSRRRPRPELRQRGELDVLKKPDLLNLRVYRVNFTWATALSWSYGINRMMKNIAEMNMKLNKVMQWYWKSVWTVIVPLGSVGILIFVLSDWTPPSYEDYVFPPFADALGWLVGLSTVILFPVGIAWAWYHGYRGKELFQPTAAWGPADRSLVTPRSDSIMTVDTVHTGQYDNIGYIM
ncbi:Sodium- and chloride-dependent glycine transporter 1 [Eumeta japonica]|uniref:Transporter n=1 Tax=Eumeta variegata TaxID=151549 RepID=A0A4C1YGA0_EUMVA|nr:Sodium- and chloride-dependent glycine transporter 1 [Eumeta japonica]